MLETAVEFYLRKTLQINTSGKELCRALTHNTLFLIHHYGKGISDGYFFCGLTQTDKLSMVRNILSPVLPVCVSGLTVSRKLSTAYSY